MKRQTRRLAHLSTYEIGVILSKALNMGPCLRLQAYDKARNTVDVDRLTVEEIGPETEEELEA